LRHVTIRPALYLNVRGESDEELLVVPKNNLIQGIEDSHVDWEKI